MNRQDCGIIKLIEAIRASFDYPNLETQMGRARKDTLMLNSDRKMGNVGLILDALLDSHIMYMGDISGRI